MSRTLNQLIESAISGGEEVEEASVATTKVAHVAVPETPAVDLGDVEKIASALEFVGERGIASFIAPAPVEEPEIAEEAVASSQEALPEADDQAGAPIFDATAIRAELERRIQEGGAHA